MKKASIISIGNELLSGQSVDTSAAWLAEKLFSINIPVVSGYTIGDDIKSIQQALKMSLSDAELLFLTGGLGPTEDDLTRDALAKLLGVKLEVNEPALKRINDFFGKIGREMPQRNKRQACIPQGAEPVRNSCGTAAGIRAEIEGRIIFAMPGVPAEMKKMFLENIFPYLKTLVQNSKQCSVVVRKLKCFGAGESAIAERIGDYMKRGRNPLINSTVHRGTVTLHIIARAEDEQTSEEMAQNNMGKLRRLLGDYVFGEGEQTLAEVVGSKLRALKQTVATAESCTGGLVAKLLTDIPGASEYFTTGWIVYSDRTKIEQLKVSTELIRKNGAVSKQVAAAMANNAREIADADYAIGITGIAGPSGGTEQKPVGLVYISVNSRKKTEVKRFIFPSDRDSVRLRSALNALNLLRLELKS